MLLPLSEQPHIQRRAFCIVGGIKLSINPSAEAPTLFKFCKGLKARGDMFLVVGVKARELLRANGAFMRNIAERNP